MARAQLPASFFGMVLGLSGIGQAWRQAHLAWQLPAVIGETILAFSTLVWASLVIGYVVQAWIEPVRTANEFKHPVQGSTPALIGVSTLLIVIAVKPWSLDIAWALALAGLAWHVGFMLWHTGTLWQGGRELEHVTPAIYLPTVAGNFTSAAALGALGHPDWGWMFLGCGVFSWFAIESPIFLRLWQGQTVPVPQRPLIGIQFAPPVVCAMALLLIEPVTATRWALMLWGYGLFQLLLGLRLWRWLGEQSFAPSYWSYTFGIAATTVVALKLALLNVPAARVLAPFVFAGGNLFIGYLTLRTAWLGVTGKLLPKT
jgi:tellurite resistance protein